jgi:ribosomal protein S15P/S13E
LAPTIPEDLYHLIKKAVSVRKHLERNRTDRDSKLYVPGNAGIYPGDGTLT